MMKRGKSHPEPTSEREIVSARGSTGHRIAHHGGTANNLSTQYSPQKQQRLWKTKVLYFVLGSLVGVIVFCLHTSFHLIRVARDVHPDLHELAKNRTEAKGRLSLKKNAAAAMKRPLQKKAAKAASKRRPRDYDPKTAKTYDMPTEEQIPFVDLDLDDDILPQVEKLVRDQPEVYEGREHLMGMLLEMNMTVTGMEEKWKEVPKWKEIQQAHGSKPVVYGLETCKAFRDTVPAVDRHLAIAGMFNTGTNLLAILLQHNCGIPERIDKMGRMKGHGMEWQVPYGKHTPVWLGRKTGHHDSNFAVQAKRSDIGDIPVDDCLVGVMVRHPHDWVKSMCRHGYTASWDRNKENCPNLYNGNSVSARFGAGTSKHESIAHMWNDWYGAYKNFQVKALDMNETIHITPFPRVLIRFEDVIFYPKQLSRILCGCVGGQLYIPKEEDSIFHYVIDSAKTGQGHGPDKQRNGLIDAWIKYGKVRDLSTFSKSDLQFMDQTFDKHMMKSLHWHDESS